LGQDHDLTIDPGRLPAGVEFRYPPHAQQRIGAATEHQLLQIADLLEVPCLRRREDALPQTPYVIPNLTPVDGLPVRVALRSVRHTGFAPLRQRRCGHLHRHGVQLAHRLRVLGHRSRHGLT
jgi:hypothetical protein